MSEKQEHPERRQYLRIKKHFILSYYDTAHPGKKFEATQLKNISLGGVCFLTSEYYAPGSVLAIELKTPYLTGTTHLEARVLQSHEKLKGNLYETRLNFEKLSPQAELVIEKIVDYFKQGEQKAP